MKNNKIVFLCFLINIGIRANAQDNLISSHKVTLKIPDIALIDIEADGSSDIDLALTAPSEGGMPAQINSSINNNLWLNYSSLYNQNTSQNNGKTRSISARVVSGAIPSGIILNVQATAASSDGRGQKGVPGAENVALNNQDQIIIINIGSCYTGTGVGKGHQLSYSIEIDQNNVALIDNAQNDAVVTVGYTISDN